MTILDKFGETLLLNPEGFMCCLGFDAVACGIPKTAIENKEDPSDVVNDNNNKLSATVLEHYTKTRTVTTEFGYTEHQNNTAVKVAITANDATNISEFVREERVKEALLKLDWDEVKFVGITPKGMLG